MRATAKVGELLTLKETANFNGDIVTGKIAIEPGARFSGNCTMNQGNSKEFRIPVTQDEIGPEEKP